MKPIQTTQTQRLEMWLAIAESHIARLNLGHSARGVDLIYNMRGAMRQGGRLIPAMIESAILDIQWHCQRWAKMSA